MQVDEHEKYCENAYGHFQRSIYPFIFAKTHYVSATIVAV